MSVITKKHCRHALLLFILAAIGVALTHCTQTNNNKEGATEPYDFSPIANKIQSWVDSNYYDGASILIAREHQVMYEDDFGNYDSTTQVYIASAGKWLGAATIAAVVEEGKLQWDDPVHKWLPEFTDVKGKATLRQLLSHTSGYPDYQPKGRQRDDYQTLEEAVRHMVDLPADTLPGTEFHYGGLSMQVAGRMAELATGKDWETLFQEKIAQPLAMAHTHFTPVDSAGGHNPMIAGGARSTLHDYAHFLDMILNNGMYQGKRILSKESIQEMQADQVKAAEVHPGEYVEKVRSKDHTGMYGLGEWRELLNDQGEAMMISSPSWAGAYPWIDKEYGVYGFFLTHVNPEIANRHGFNSFLSSPVLAMMTREVIENK